MRRCLVLLAWAWAGAARGFVIQSRCATPGHCQSRNETLGCVLGTEPACGCLASARGVACLECSFQGFLNADGTCTCYASTLDPNNAQAPCTALVPVVVPQTVQVQHSRVTCECHQSRLLGFFLPSSDPDQHVFGDPSPPTCTRCAGAIFGPDPFVVTDNRLNPLQVCNTYGGPDPVRGPSGWFSCSGHGTWSADAYRCTCDPGWMLRDTGLLGAHGEPGLSCDACAPFRGPGPADGGCATIWTPDPRTGRAAECSGHGVQTSDGTCDCFANATHGYWRLAPVSAHFTLLEYDNPLGTAYSLQDTVVTEQACTKCMDGFSGAECDQSNA